MFGYCFAMIPQSFYFDALLLMLLSSKSERPQNAGRGLAPHGAHRENPRVGKVQKLLYVGFQQIITEVGD